MRLLEKNEISNILGTGKESDDAQIFIYTLFGIAAFVSVFRLEIVGGVIAGTACFVANLNTSKQQKEDAQ